MDVTSTEQEVIRRNRESWKGELKRLSCGNVSCINMQLVSKFCNLCSNITQARWQRRAFLFPPHIQCWTLQKNVSIGKTFVFFSFWDTKRKKHKKDKKQKKSNKEKKVIVNLCNIFWCSHLSFTEKKNSYHALSVQSPKDGETLYLELRMIPRVSNIICPDQDSGVRCQYSKGSDTVWCPTWCKRGWKFFEFCVRPRVVGVKCLEILHLGVGESTGLLRSNWEMLLTYSL